ncbi:transporter substrate-binding domain-containing protein [Siminovitchia acidinfaciens]|uniref:histidine kinase n=1 Tax=Siminovitchia acidinfaciens TaxID=2321395 RepID=A0A429XU85_9BACI|nr:transporter substrate-binding domain-containing protein [Siminovitchia acidinfaciens]RST71524.1 transporter substrate-binding domain-containing protein [Siminovitchia acidinfaciens]
MFKKIVIICLLLLFSSVPRTAHGEPDDNPSEGSGSYLPDNRVLKVGFDPQSPPYQFIRDDRYVGFNIDLIEKVAEDQNFYVKYVPLSINQSIEALREGEIDIILGVPFRAEYSEVVDFTDRYLTSSVGVLVPADSPIKELTDLQGKRVAIQYDTMEYEFLKNIRNIHYHSAHNAKTGLEVVYKGRADAYVGNQITAKYLLNEKGLDSEYRFLDSHLLPLEYSFAVQKGNYLLMHHLNVGIRHLKLTDSYSGIYNKWFENFESPLSEKLKKIREALIFIVILALIIFLLGFRWNRTLQREVNRKTKDLQTMNLSLKEQVQKTKNSDQFKEQILESSARGVVTCDHNGIITTINRVALDMMGEKRKPEGIKASNFPFLWNMLEGNIDETIKSGKKIIGKEQELTLPQRGTCFIRYDIQPLYNFEKKTTGALLMFEDITTEKTIKDQLQEQEKSQALIQLVAGLAHEIRNPLTSIKTFVQLIPIKMDNERFRSEISTLVPKEIERLNQLVEGLINYAKPGSKEAKPINLEKLIQSTIILFKQEAENKNINIDWELESELWIEADESQISQVLINIFLNAIESMDNKRKNMNEQTALTFSIRAYQAGNEVVVALSDEGEGMTEEETRKIFEPFYTSKTSGTGLGLSLSKQYIMENKGSLMVESKPGSGSVFELRFPKKEN